jgi:hypothetical protein
MRALYLVLAMSLCACASGAAEDSIEDEMTLPPPSDPLASHAAKSSGPPDGWVTGTLTFEDIEGGCAFLRAEDGRSYEVIYPDGWSLDRSSGTLIGPHGESALAGQTIRVRGAVAPDMSSICQVGPIFVATEVEIVAP